jgi:hypothetical protein
MKNLKLIILSILFLNINTANAQLYNIDLDRSWIKNKKTARKAYIKCVGDGFNERIFVRLDSKKLEFLPIGTFEFSKTLLNDEIEKDIVEHLVPASGFPISSVIVLNEKKYDSYLAFDEGIKKRKFRSFCAYSDSKEFGPDDYGRSMYDGLRILEKYNFTFLFSVKFVRNCIWFVDGDEVRVLNLDYMLIYTPDQFIEEFCSIETLRSLVSGNLEKYCY